jgi:hypothetical protein
MIDSPRTPETQPQAEQVMALTRVTDLIERALKGELARDREPTVAEPKVLTPLHVNMVLDRAAGYQVREIAERWDYTEVQVSNILGSPDAQTILSTILAMQAGALVSMEARFKAIAPQALNVKVQILNDPAAPVAVRDRVATDILDRAGYAPKQKFETKHDHRIFLPAQVATGLKTVLEESQRVSTMDYSSFLHKSGAEVASSHLQLGSGQPEVADSAPPVSAPDSPSREKVA